ncbi:LiaF domain-containing protein [[Clostridium] cellulosi]
MNRKTASEIVAGIFVIALGMLTLFKALFGWTLDISAASFWALVIMAVAITSIIHRGVRFYNVVFLIIGGWIIINDLGLLGRHTFLTLVAIIIIAFGMWIVYNAVKASVVGNSTSADMNDFIHFSNSFNNVKIANSSKSFKGGHITSTFGTITIDLSQIAIQSNAIIDISATFGSIIIIMPRNIPYRTDVTPVFGTFINNAPIVPPTNGLPFLMIKGSAVFGTCTLK